MDFGVHKVDLASLKTQQHIPMPPTKKPSTASKFLLCDHRLECSDSINGLESEKCTQCKNNRSIKRRSFFEPI